MTDFSNHTANNTLPLNQILCGDSTPLLSGFPSESIDLVVTDPPFLINYRDRDGRTIANDDNPDAVLSVYEELYRDLGAFMLALRDMIDESINS